MLERMKMSRKKVAGSLVALTLLGITGCSSGDDLEPSSVEQGGAARTSSTTKSSSPQPPSTTSTSQNAPSSSVELPISDAGLKQIQDRAVAFTYIAMNPDMSATEKTSETASMVLAEYLHDTFNAPAVSRVTQHGPDDEAHADAPVQPKATLPSGDPSATRYISLAGDLAIIETKFGQAQFQLWFRPKSGSDWRISDIAWDSCPTTVSCPYVTKSIEKAS